MVVLWLLCGFPLVLGGNHCCPFKEVLIGSSKEVFNFKEKRSGIKGEGCMDGCVYTKDGEDYCFGSDETFQVECIDDGSSEVCFNKKFLTFKHKAALHFDEILVNLTGSKSNRHLCLPSSCQPRCTFSQFSSCDLVLYDALRACSLADPDVMKACMERQVNAIPRDDCIPCVCKAIYIQYSTLTPGCIDSDGCPSVSPASCTLADGCSCEKNNSALVITGGDNQLGSSQKIDSSEQISYMGVCSSPNIPLLPDAITGGKSVWMEPNTLMFCGGSLTYVSGGTNSGATNKCLKLTPGGTAWTSNPSYNMNVDRSWFSLNYINGYGAVAAGGINNANTVLNSLERYSGGQWEMINIQLDNPTYLHCAVQYNKRDGDSYLMIIGGISGGDAVTASVTEINLSTGVKVSVAPGPLPGLMAPACTICGDDIYVSGGGKNNGQTTDVYKYNIPNGGPFTRIGNLNTPRWGHTMGVTSKGQLVVSAGWEQDGNRMGYLSSIESSEDGGTSWKTWGTRLSQPQQYASMASVPAFTFTCTG